MVEIELWHEAKSNIKKNVYLFAKAGHNTFNMGSLRYQLNQYVLITLYSIVGFEYYFCEEWIIIPNTFFLLSFLSLLISQGQSQKD